MWDIGKTRGGLGHDFVVNQRRTSLLEGRAEKLVRVHANARMARRVRGLNHSENYISQSDSCSKDSDSESEFLILLKHDANVRNTTHTITI